MLDSGLRRISQIFEIPAFVDEMVRFQIQASGLLVIGDISTLQLLVI